MEINGKLIEKFEMTQVSERFRKREFVTESGDNPQYPDFIKFECIQDRCNLIDEFEIGDEITVHFDIRGRKWTGNDGDPRYFVSLQPWRIVALNPATKQAGSAVTEDDIAEEMDSINAEGGDNIPF